MKVEGEGLDSSLPPPDSFCHGPGDCICERYLFVYSESSGMTKGSCSIVTWDLALRFNDQSFDTQDSFSFQP